MQQLSESLFIKNNQQFDSIFKKVSIYQKRMGIYGIHESYNYHSYDIMFNLNEQEAIHDMFAIFESEMLNEFSLSEAKDKFNELKEFFIKIKNGVITKVSELIKAFLQLFSKLGDKISDILAKLKMEGEETYKLLESYVKAKIQDKSLENVNVFEELTLFGFNSLNEAELNELDKEKWRKSKGLQAVFGYKFPGGLSVWKTLIISVLGSIVVCSIIPMMAATFGASASMVTLITIGCKVLWVGRGTCKVLLQRWVNKEDDEKFWDFKTVLQLLLVIGIPAIFSIPAVKEGLTKGLMTIGEKLGIDKWADKCEEWFYKITQKWTSKDYAHYSVTERMELVEKDMSAVMGSPEGNAGVASMFASSTTDYDGSHAEGYINNIFDKLGNKFDTVKDKLGDAKEWFNKIAEGSFKSSAAMQDAVTGSYNGDNLMFAVDSQRVGSLMTQPEFVKRVGEILQDKGIEGTFVNAINDNLHNATNAAAGTVEVLMCDCNATQENIDIVKAAIEEAVGKAGEEGKVASTFCELINSKVVEATKLVPELKQSMDLIHIWFKTAVEAFTPMYMPIFKHKDRKFRVRLGSNTTGARVYTITDIQTMSYKDLMNGKGTREGLNVMIEQENKIRKKHAAQIKKEIEELKLQKTELEKHKDKNSEEISKVEEQIKKKAASIQREIKKYNTEDVQKHKVLVFYGTYKYYKKNEEGRVVKDKVYVSDPEPAFYLNPNTMQGQDIAITYSRRRVHPYYLKGLFSRLEFLPIEGGLSKEEIASNLNETFATWIKLCADNVGMNNIAERSNDKFVPVDPADQKRPELGNFTNAEFAGIFNKEYEPYKFLSGEYADDSINGGLKHDYIEQQKDDNGNVNYINDKIKPWIKNKKGNIYKQIAGNDELKKYLIDDEGEIKEPVIDMIAPLLYRTNAAYLDDAKKKEVVNRIITLFKNEDGSEKSVQEAQKDRQLVLKLVDIIWEEYYKARTRRKANESYESQHNEFNKRLFENYLGLRYMIKNNL